MMSKMDSCDDMKTCGRDQSMSGEPTRTISIPHPHIAIRDQIRAYRRYRLPDGLSGQVKIPSVAHTIVHPMAHAHFKAPTTRTRFTDSGNRRIIGIVPSPRKHRPLAMRMPRAALAALLGALALLPGAARAEVVRVAVLATEDAPEVARLRAENAVATHQALELAGARALPAGAPRAALVDAARSMRADLLLVVQGRTTRLWDAHRGLYAGVTLGPDASRAALRGLIAEGLEAAMPARGGLPGWLTVGIAGAAAALFATFILVRVTEPDPETGLTLSVVSP
jgi:hypothetical protein